MDDRSDKLGIFRSTTAAGLALSALAKRFRAKPPLVALLSLGIASVSLYVSLSIFSSQWLHYSWSRISSHVPGNSGIARALEHLRDEDMQWIDLTPVIASAHADDSGVSTGDKKRATVRGVNLAGANLSNAWFDDTDFSKAVLTGSNLSRVKARYAIFKDVNLREAVMKEARFDHSDLSGVIMTKAEAYKLRLFDTTLKDGKFDESSMNEADLRQAKALNASFVHSRLGAADLSGGVFTGSSFKSARLVGATLTQGRYGKVKFIDADLSGAILVDGYYGGANFRGANLSGVQFTGASVPRTDFSAANLSGAEFVGAKGIDSAIWDRAWAWKDRPPRFPEGVEVNVTLCNSQFRPAWEKKNRTAGHAAIPESCRPWQ